MLFFIDKEFDKKFNLFIFHFGSGQIDLINHIGRTWSYEQSVALIITANCGV